MTVSQKLIKRIALGFGLLFIAMNIVAAFHAYGFTHFSERANTKTKDPTKLSFMDKLCILAFGISNPRPVDGRKPDVPYKTIILQSNKKIECWYMDVARPKGVVLLFHGYAGSKSGNLDQAKVFNKLGYSTLLVGFMGSGGSEGNQTTIGFYEAMQVQTAVGYAKQVLKHRNIILYGTSMGAAAIMKYLNDSGDTVQGTILECPFGTMLQTVRARFNTMHVPSFPMANLLVFWGGLENSFNAFAHKPEAYATRIRCPILLLYGEQDDKVSRHEIDAIYHNLPGPKTLKLYPLAGHEEYLKVYPVEWERDIGEFGVMIDLGR